MLLNTGAPVRVGYTVLLRLSVRAFERASPPASAVVDRGMDGNSNIVDAW
jgi:hypothetical protein